MTDKIDTSAEAVEAIAFEYDERAKIAAELIALCPQSELRMERSKPSRDFHTKTAATLRALQVEVEAAARITAEKDRQNEEPRAEVERLTDALEAAEQACEDRADRLDEYEESACCAGTARNCASDIAALKGGA